MSRKFQSNKRTNNCKKTNTGKSTGRKFSREEDDSIRKDLKSKTNDPNWYATDPAILRDAASIPFSWSVGTTLDIGIDENYVIPGICVIDTVPSYGYSTDTTSPLNVASRSIYSFIRHANSGHANYDAPDLMTYILEMSQVYSYINYLQRAYGVAMLYAQRNRYLPDALLRAMKIDPVDIQSNMAEFRYGINVLINKAASLAVPAVFTLFSRQAFMYQNVYSEGTSIKDQLYLYNPKAFWAWGTVDNSSGLALVPFCPESVNPDNKTGLFTVSDLLLFGNNMLSGVLESEDLNIMSGDILKAYGDSGIIKLVSLAPDYVITPIYDEMVLEQMKNSMAVGYASFSNLKTWKWGNMPNNIYTFGTIGQDATKGFLTCTPALTIIKPSLPASIMIKLSENAYSKFSALVRPELAKLKPIMTTSQNEASPELVMELSRLMCEITKIGTEVYGGSEIVYNFRLIRNKYVPATETEPGRLDYYETNYNSVVIAENPSIQEAVDNWGIAIKGAADIAMLHAFKFRPTVYLYEMTGTVDDTHLAFKGIVQNVDNYAVIDDQLVKKLNEAALLNQLHVNSIAKIG